jgi:ADP-ribose pyrophosphatase YjhB (NUDIX family)
MNATGLAIEKGYPERVILPDELTSWEVNIPDHIDYGSPVVDTKPDHGTTIEKMIRGGLPDHLNIGLEELARMSNGEVATHYGNEFASALHNLRCPLGRTGINGVGIFYEAGAALTSDLIAVHDDSGELWVSLVYSRGRWNTPGGFREESDKDGLHAAAREFEEETGQEVPSFIVPVLSEVKSSDRTADNGWIEAEVFATQVESRFKLIAGDDAEDAKWERVAVLPEMVEAKQLSKAKMHYIDRAVEVLLN